MKEPSSHILKEILRTFFSPATTIQFSGEDDNSFYENYRGKLTCHAELCIGCGSCMRTCPIGALHLKRFEIDGLEQYELYHDLSQCAYCALCEDACPTSAIFFENQFVNPVMKKEDAIQLLTKGSYKKKSR